MCDRRRGFTYIEMALVIALSLIFLALGVGLSRSSHSRPQSRSAAQVLAAFLQSNRELARSSGQPVGLVWPATVSSECEALQGWQNPRRVDCLKLGKDFPDFSMFVGSWNDQFVDQRPSWGTRDDSWDPAAWLPGRTALIFLPSGKVTASGVLRWQDSYRLVVGKGMATQGNLLRGGQNCLDVRISPSGWVDWVNDVTLAGGAGLTTPVALGPGPASGTGPTLQTLHITPDPADLQLPSGIQALVSAEGFLTLEMEASSPAGQTLFCRWSGDGGAFSHQQRQPMRWDPASGHWRSHTEWRPPDTAGDGAQFQLTCHVTDEWEREAPQTINGQVTLEVRNSKARMAFIDVASVADTRHRLQVVHEDGTGKRELSTPIETSPGEVPKAAWSPDGTRLAYFGQNKLYCCNAEGGGRVQVDGALPGQAVSLQGVYWNADGNWLAHIRSLPNGRRQVFLVRPDGTGGSNLNGGPQDDDFVRNIAGSATNSNMVSRDNSIFSADGKYLASLRPGGVQLYGLPGSGAGNRFLPDTSLIWSVVWNPIQPWLAFSSGGQLKVYDVAASTYFTPTPVSPYATGPGAFSPDGNRYLFGRGAQMHLATLRPDHTATITPTLVDGQAMGWLDDERFTFWRESPSDMWVRELASGQQQNLTNEARDVMFCGWTK